MAASPDIPRKRGCIARLLFLICLCAALLLGVALFFMYRPQDVSDMAGYGENAEARDLTLVLRESIERGHELTLTEHELNCWLAKRVKLEQKGLLADEVTLIRVGVRLEDGRAEIVIERELFGQPLTLSMFLQVHVTTEGNTATKEVLLHGGPLIKGMPAFSQGGRFGCLPVPQGYLYLVKSAFFQLAEACDEELELVFKKMSDIRIEKDQLVLRPRQAPVRPSR